MDSITHQLIHAENIGVDGKKCLRQFCFARDFNRKHSQSNLSGFFPLEHIFKPTFQTKEQLYGPICLAQYTSTTIKL